MIAETYTVSQAYTCDNLTIFLIHGEEKLPDVSLLTLQESLALCLRNRRNPLLKISASLKRVLRQESETPPASSYPADNPAP